MIEKFAPVKVILTLNKAQEEYSIRDLAKRAKIGVGTAKQYLDWLFSKDIVKRRVIGKTHQYKLNLDNILARHLKILISLNEIKSSGIIAEIKDKWPILSIVLYGSTARGDDEPKSDIDLLIISRKNMKIGSLKAEKGLMREITIISYSLAEWRRKAKEDKPFYDRIVSEGIALFGEKPIVK